MTTDTPTSESMEAARATGGEVMLRDMWDSGWFERGVMIVVGSVALALVAVAVMVTHSCADMAAGTEAEERGRVVRHEYSAGHSYTTMQPAYVNGKMATIPTTNYKPETWRLWIDVGGGSLPVAVDATTYHELADGDSVTVIVRTAKSGNARRIESLRMETKHGN